MTYLFEQSFGALTAVNISLIPSANQLVMTTNPNMTFIVFQAQVEMLSVSGLSNTPVIAITATLSGNNISAAASMSGATTANQTKLLAIGQILSIPPNSGIYVQATTPATATTCLIRLSLWGAYR